jgi:hypothetical protein
VAAYEDDYLVVVTKVPNDGDGSDDGPAGPPCRGTFGPMTMRAFGREEMDKIVGGVS